MTSEPTRDAFLGGRLTLLQSSSGHRAGTDAALLAACVPAETSGLVYDLGAGVGAAGLSVAVRSPAASVTLVEIDAGLAGLARRSIEENRLEARVSVAVEDLTRRQEQPAQAVADWVIMNPPFHPAGTVRTSPDSGRRRAHEQPVGADDAWLRRAALLAKPGAACAIIHRADALPRLLTALERRFGDIRIKPVEPRAGHAAVRILVRARAGSRAPLRILPALVLHGGDGRFTPEAAALHRGETDIDWLDA